MADNRKEQERDELHRTIWGIANDLRGSVDGWDFKQYVLGMLFYRYISENFTNYINDGEREAGDATFDYAQLSDSDAEQARDDLIKTKGFFILPSQLFCGVRSRAPLDGLMVHGEASVVKHCCDPPVAVSAFVFMVNCREFFFDGCVFVCFLHLFQMVVECGTGQLSD